MNNCQHLFITMHSYVIPHKLKRNILSKRCIMCGLDETKISFLVPVNYSKNKVFVKK